MEKEEQTKKPKEEVKRNKASKEERPKTEEEAKENKGSEKTEKKKEERPKVKKTEAVVVSFNLPISTKQSIAICRFIKNKNIENAIKDLEQVILHKKPVPMKGEIPHKKGKGIMSGRYPENSAGHFIRLLKSLRANSNANELNNPIISEASANLASRPFGRFGRVRKKRTHVKIIACEKKSSSKQKKKRQKEKEK